MNTPLDMASRPPYNTRLSRRKLGMKAQQAVGQFILSAILLLLAGTMILPFIYILVVSSQTRRSMSAASSSFGRGNGRSRPIT
jgi:ABC-type glycerol-3-phosphate transport system permease component